MKTTILTVIFILALGVMVLPTKLAIAAPMGSAFTYQSRLMDANEPAAGLYDLQLKLYDSLAGGTQVGSTLDANEVDVNDGYFALLLDFGSAAAIFNGDARWLEIGVREGALDDPNVYIVLVPRQELTPAPYALYAANAPGGGGADNDWKVAGTNMFSMPIGNVGIGTTSPEYKLDVNGDVKATTARFGTDDLVHNADLQAAHRINICDYDGVSWNPNLYIGDSGSDYVQLLWNSSGDYGELFTSFGHDIILTAGGNVGIGTDSPEEKLHVEGTIEVDQKIQANDSGGLELATDEGTTRLLIHDNGNVGIGTTNPQVKLEVRASAGSGVFAYGPSVQGYGVRGSSPRHGVEGVSTGGKGVYGTSTTGYAGYFEGPKNYFEGNVGIGTISPAVKLEVNGQIKINGGSPGAGKVLTSDGSGLGSWQTPTAGDITAVTAGTGLSGGGTSGPVSLEFSTSWGDARYVEEGQSGSVTSAMIADDTITQSDIATNGVGASEIASGAVGNSELANGAVTSVKIADGATLVEILDDDGAGSGLDADKLDGLDSSAYVGGNDNLGNHTATQNIRLNGHYLSGDGGNEGVYVAGNGDVGIGTSNPQSKLSVGGNGIANTGVYGSGSSIGVWGEDSDNGSHGRLGFATYGVYGSGSSAGVWGEDSDSGSYGRLGYGDWGGYFSGDGYFSGNVGIGTSSPAEKLDVRGNINISITSVYKIAGATVLSSPGTSNIFVGEDAGASNIHGRYNSAVGVGALYSNTSGYSNSAVGNRALESNTTGSYNSAIGLGALQSNTTGGYNSAIGLGALKDNTTGKYNSAIGYWAGFKNSTGDGNVFIGYKAGYNETGSDKLYIDNSDTSTPLIHGDFATNRIGINRVPTTNTLEVGGNASKSTAGDWLANSDARIKTDVQTVSNALETLDKVRLVSFKYTDDYQAKHASIEKRRYVNVIAQEFRQVFPDYVKSSKEKLTNGDEILQVDAYPLTVYSAAAVQELHEIVKAKDAEIVQLKERVSKMESLLDKLLHKQEGGQR